jgi:hypothetical protein
VKCQECPYFLEDICTLASDGKVSEIDNIVCLLRLVIVLLRDITLKLADKDGGEEWKQD